jgi:hypothetical protein
VQRLHVGRIGAYETLFLRVANANRICEEDAASVEAELFLREEERVEDDGSLRPVQVHLETTVEFESTQDTVDHTTARLFPEASVERDEDEPAGVGDWEIGGQTRQRVHHAVTSEAPGTDLGAIANTQPGGVPSLIEPKRRAVPHVLEVLEVLDRLPPGLAQHPESVAPEILDALVRMWQIRIGHVTNAENRKEDCAPGDAVEPASAQRTTIEPNVRQPYTS